MITNDDAPRAQAEADALASYIWNRRDEWIAESLKPAAAIEAGEKLGKFPIVLADQSDNTGGGAPGDSTLILRLFLERDVPSVVLYVIDPITAAQAAAAGVGAMIDAEIGGRSHPSLGPPVPMRAEVVALTDGEFVYDGPMWKGVTERLGPTAWLRTGEVSVVVTTYRQQPVDLALCRSLGMDVASFRYVCVKSTGHFRSGFEPIAGSVHSVDAKGLLGHTFVDLPYTRLGRPMYPIAPDCEKGF